MIRTLLGFAAVAAITMTAFATGNALAASLEVEGVKQSGAVPLTLGFLMPTMNWTGTYTVTGPTGLGVVA